MSSRIQEIVVRYLFVKKGGGCAVTTIDSKGRELQMWLGVIPARAGFLDEVRTEGLNVARDLVHHQGFSDKDWRLPDHQEGISCCGVRLGESVITLSTPTDNLGRTQLMAVLLAILTVAGEWTPPEEKVASPFWNEVRELAKELAESEK